jgi:tetratricopeptide (TPR) repeat protein
MRFGLNRCAFPVKSWEGSTIPFVPPGSHTLPGRVVSCTEYPMTYEHLDDDELLRLSLDAMQGTRDADAVAMLKTLVGRSRDHAYARYLLAAQHAQMGLMDKAEDGFHAAIALSPGLAMARFQLGQLLLLKGDADQAASVLTPLQSEADPALSAYAGALLALASDRVQVAIEQLEAGLACPQAVPVLAEDMHQLLAGLRARVSEEVVAAVEPEMGSAAASLLLTNYGRYN